MIDEPWVQNMFEIAKLIIQTERDWNEEIVGFQTLMSTLTHSQKTQIFLFMLDCNNIQTNEDIVRFKNKYLGVFAKINETPL